MLGSLPIPTTLALALLSACSEPPSPPILDGLHLSTADLPEGLVGPEVVLADGTRLVASEVSPRVRPEGRFTVEAWLVPGEPQPGDTVTLDLFRAGTSKPAESWTPEERWPPEDWTEGQAVRLHGRLELPPESKEDHYWLHWQIRRADGKRVKAPDLRTGQLSLGALRVGGKPIREAVEAQEPPEGPLVAAGGDLMLGRRQNGLVGRNGPHHALEGIPVLAEADLAFANLECVVATAGDRKVGQGEPVPHYFRGRPETLAVLTEAGIDVVQTANNHGGDYGHPATLEQVELLRAAGIAAVGTGADRQAACAPAYTRAGDLTVAWLARDFTTPVDASTESAPGVCYHDPKDPEGLKTELSAWIQEARKRADVVLVGAHWVMHPKPRPKPWNRRMAKAIIQAGADAVIGSSNHMPLGVEVIGGRPVIYDTGDLLFDMASGAGRTTGMLALLHLVPGGVARIEGVPLESGYGYTTLATGNKAAKALYRYRDLSLELGTLLRLESDRAVLDLPLPPERPGPTEAAPPDLAATWAPSPLEAPPPGCRVAEVPADARIDPVDFGPIRLLGLRLDKDRMGGRGIVWAETWWTAPEPVDTDYWIYQRMMPPTRNVSHMWWADHEPCDWQWPTSRWEAGGIYADLYGVRAPRQLPDGDYGLRMGLMDEEGHAAPSVDFPGVSVIRQRP